MIFKGLAIASLAIFCACESLSTDSIESEETGVCLPVAMYGAVADDGIDDRLAIQAALDACSGGTVDLGDGQYTIVTPTGRPRTFKSMLTVRPNTRIRGTGFTEILFVGNNGGLDWNGFAAASGTEFDHFDIRSAFDAGTVVEQTHLIKVDGPIRGAHIHHMGCEHPAPNGVGKNGDCVEISGYPPAAEGQPDKYVWDIEIDHMKFLLSYRSGIAWHGGIQGTWVNGHSTSRFHDNEIYAITDQGLDGEGIGGVKNLEIDHNKFYANSVNRESAVVVQLQGTENTFFHDNELFDRGIDVYGCVNCRFEHNKYIQSGEGNSPNFYLRKESPFVAFADETFDRASDAPANALLRIESKGSGAPSDVTIRDSKFTQRGSFDTISATGIDGLKMQDSQITYLGAAYAPPNGNLFVGVRSLASGVNVNPACRDNSIPGAPDAIGIRASRLIMENSTVSGAYRATMLVSGSRCGTGSVSLRGVFSPNAANGLVCENINQSGKVLGPIELIDNEMASSVCAVP